MATIKIPQRHLATDGTQTGTIITFGGLLIVIPIIKG